MFSIGIVIKEGGQSVPFAAAAESSSNNGKVGTCVFCDLHPYGTVLPVPYENLSSGCTFYDWWLVHRAHLRGLHQG